MSWRRNLVWLVVYVALGFALLAPLSLHPATRLPEDGDSLQNLWIIWWGANHFDRGYPGIFDANAYYPHPTGLLYSEPMFGQALLGSWLFRNLDNHVLASNLLMIVTLALSAFAAHLLFRELTGSNAAAAVGAILYAFNCYNLSQLPRFQLITLQWMPLALLSLHRFFDRNETRYIFGFVAFSILHGLSSFYYLMFYLVALALILPAYIWAYRSWKRPGSMAWVGGSGLVIGAAILPVALPYMRLYDRYGYTGHPGSFDLARFFQPPPDSLLYAALETRPHLVDHFLGYVALLLGALGLFAFLRSSSSRTLRAVALSYFLVGVMGFLLSGGPELIVDGTTVAPGPYRILQEIGPFGNLRAPGRFAILARLALSLFLAQGAAALFASSRPMRRAWGCAVLATVVIGEQWSPRRVQGTAIPTGDRIPEAYRWLADNPGTNALVELPVHPFRAIRFTSLESYFSTFHQRHTLFSKPSFYPPAMELLQSELGSFPDRRSITLLQALKVDQAVVHPKRWVRPRRRRRFLSAVEERNAELTLLQTFPDREDPLWDRYKLGGERIYTIQPLKEEGSPRACSCREISRDAYRLEAKGANHPRFAADGDRETKWTSGNGQRTGQYFDILFDEPRRPARIEIEMVFPYGEFARNLEFIGYRGDETQRIEPIEDVWYTVGLVRQLIDDPTRARLRYDLQPTEVNRLRLLIGRAEPGVIAWSIPEIHIFEKEGEPARRD